MGGSGHEGSDGLVLVVVAGVVAIAVAGAVVVDFCQVGDLATGGTVNGGDDEFGIDAAKRRVSYLGEGTLGENTGIEVSTARTTKTGRAWQAIDGQMGRWADGRWQMKQAIDRQIVARRSRSREGSRSSGRSGYSHQQTRFSASTIADNDELSAEFCHFGGCGL